jgi:anaerobic magnesium-protoporphyrin IX monomethyl ester cyclase
MDGDALSSRDGSLWRLSRIPRWTVRQGDIWAARRRGRYLDFSGACRHRWASANWLKFGHFLMAHVTLIKPPTVVNMSSLSFHNSLPPLGLAYMSAIAKAAGHTVVVIDAPGEDIERYHPFRKGQFNLFTHGLSLPEIVERIPTETRVVGLTNMFLHEWPLIKDLIPLIRKRVPGALIVMGGETPTAFWWRMMEESPELDCCVLGEGEVTFEELLATVDKGGKLADVASVAYRDDTGKAVKSAVTRKRVRDIEDLPRPDWEAFRVDEYLSRQYSSGVKRGRSLPMISSRGCPYQCTFCSSPAMWTTRYVTRSPEHVADEIGDYVERYGISNVDFHDLTSMLTKRWIVRFCDVMEERGIKISWQLPSGTRCEALDAEALAALYRSGCRNLSYSPESGSEQILKDIKKRVKLPVLMKSVRSAVEQGIISNVNFILGLPDETWKDVWQTYKIIVGLAAAGAHSTAVMVFNPYPGSALFDQIYAEGKIELNDEFYFGSLLRSGRSSVSYSKTMGPPTLVAIQMGMLSTFFGLQYLLRPQRAARTLYNFVTRQKQETNMDQFLSTKWLYYKKQREASRAKRRLPLVQGDGKRDAA